MSEVIYLPSVKALFLLPCVTRTLEEVGKEFDVTWERIRQIEAKAIRKLKQPTKSKRLREFLEDKK